MSVRIGFVVLVGGLVALGCREPPPNYVGGGGGQGGSGCVSPYAECALEDGSTTCADLTTDEAHCGACGNACAAGQRCVDGTCGGGTPDACGGACAADQVCDSGTCVDEDACRPPHSICQLDEGDRGCVDLATDPYHCGACGAYCDGVCAGGFCQATNPCGALHDCGGSCVDLATDPANCGGCGVTCTTEQTCSGGSCTP